MVASAVRVPALLPTWPEAERSKRFAAQLRSCAAAQQSAGIQAQDASACWSGWGRQRSKKLGIG